MNVLAFDTTSRFLDIALETGHGSHVRFEEIGLRHSEALVPALIAVCRDAGITLQEVSLLACSRGPGSFTGLRIGMATAKGIAAGLGIPVVSVPAPEIYVEAALAAADALTPDTILLPAIDARKKRFYTAVYRNGERHTPLLDIGAAELYSRFLSSCERVLICGPDGELLAGQLGEYLPGNRVSLLPFSPAAPTLAAAAVRHLSAGETDALTQGPEYIRGTT